MARGGRLLQLNVEQQVNPIGIGADRAEDEAYRGEAGASREEQEKWDEKDFKIDSQNFGASKLNREDFFLFKMH